MSLFANCIMHATLVSKVLMLKAVLGRNDVLLQLWQCAEVML